jgi:uncharacterized protein
MSEELWIEWIDLLRSEDMTRIRTPFTAAHANTRDEDGYTLLLVACGVGAPDNADVVTYLLDCGADIEARNSNKSTALLRTAVSGKLNCLRALLLKGAAVEPKDRIGWTPLTYAVCNGHRECDAAAGLGGAAE